MQILRPERTGTQDDSVARVNRIDLRVEGVAQTPRLRLRLFHPRGLEPQTQERGLRYSLPPYGVRETISSLATVKVAPGNFTRGSPNP